MKFYSEEMLKSCMHTRLSAEDYEKFADILDRGVPGSDVIPVNYMIAYSEHHDPVCEINIKTMINGYRNGDKYE